LIKFIDPIEVVGDGKEPEKNLSIDVSDKAIMLILRDINSYENHIGLS